MKRFKITMIGILIIFMFTNLLACLFRFQKVGIILYGITTSGKLSTMCIEVKWFIGAIVIGYIIWSLYKASKVVTNERNMFINLIDFIVRFIILQIKGLFLIIKGAIFISKMTKDISNSIKEQSSIEDEEYIEVEEDN